jgi:hypothetical protein
VPKLGRGVESLKKRRIMADQLGVCVIETTNLISEIGFAVEVL